MHVGLTTAEERRWPVPLGEVSPWVLRALVAAEDRRFFDHAGVDVHAVGRALVADVTAGRFREGASTITMQLARLVLPEPRSVLGKVAQAFRAWQIERRHDKRFVLEQYVNLVPFGGNVRGVEAAARTYFGRPAATLDAPEAALLVSVLPAPTRFDPRRDRGGARRRRDHVLDRMRETGALDEAAWQRARAAPLGLSPEAFPDLAPDAWLRAGRGATTIDLRLQQGVERVAAEAGGVDGLAIVLVDVETGAIRAMAGARTPSPAVLDATDRPRSAGSSLKPFLYALAFDRGVAAPKTRLLDLPWRADHWAPTDFDRLWRGPVAAEDALEASLNVPAVRLAAAVGPADLADVLHRFGFRHVRAPHDGGADLALGTDDTTALELAGAWASLVTGGRVRRPWLSASERPAPGSGIAVVSPGAAELVVRALADRARARPAGAPLEGVAWKTGTSSSRRDAWAAGATSRYAAAVWRGRLDGRPDASLVGAEAATPILFAVLGLADPAPRPFGPPTDVVAVETCPESGLAWTDACPDPATDLVPRGAAALRPCDLHVRVRLDATTGELLCPHCASGRETVDRTFTVASPELALWRRRAGIVDAPLPPHAAGCPAPIEPPALAPVFLEPEDETTRVAKGGRVRVPVLVRASEAARLELLVDGRLTTGGAADGTFALDLGPGRHVLTAVTERGGEASVTVFVR